MEEVGVWDISVEVLSPILFSSALHIIIPIEVVRFCISSRYCPFFIMWKSRLCE